MGAVPKHKTSTYRKGKRRASINLEKKNYVACSKCQKSKLPHRVCSACGSY